VAISADDRWIADARARAAAGGWERDSEAIFEDLRRQARATPTQEVYPDCPFCADHPRLLKFPRHELQSATPLLFCGTCHGFWAVGDAISRGVSDPGNFHPALATGPAPRRCRGCFGHLKPDNTCAKCGAELPKLSCPVCKETMERAEFKGVTIDQCGPCMGVWFDMGEIAAAFELGSQQGLAASTVDEHATDDEPPAWWFAANILGRLFLPFL
jgi:Zn-finger nucleic acid-binding protein